MRKDTYYIWALLLVVVCGIAALFLFGNTEHDLQGETEVATTTNEVEVPETGVTPPVLPWGRLHSK